MTMLNEWWTTNPSIGQHHGHLTLNMFCNSADLHGTVPKLKGRAIEVRNMVPALASVWARVMDATLPEHLAILEGMKNSSLMDDILHTHQDADVLPTADCDKFVAASWQYARLQSAVADHYNKEGFLLFDVTIKTHWTCHCAMEAPFLNPRLSWNYSGEDFMGHCRWLHQSCSKGNDGPESVNKFAAKYCRGLQMIFEQFENGTRL
jgi:hypothetical protein